MHIRQGTPADFPRLAAFYRDSIDRSPRSVRFSRWIYRKHPHGQMLQVYLADGAMLLQHARPSSV